MLSAGLHGLAEGCYPCTAMICSVLPPLKKYSAAGQPENVLPRETIRLSLIRETILDNTAPQKVELHQFSRSLYFLSNRATGDSSNLANHVVKTDVRANREVRTGKMEVAHRYKCAATWYHLTSSPSSTTPLPSEIFVRGKATAVRFISHFSFIYHPLHLWFLLRLGLRCEWLALSSQSVFF